jgi:hypothetical protein
MLLAGSFVAALSVLLIILMLLAKFLLPLDYPLGIPTITILILFMGGVQLISVGVLGEYIGRIYDEVRRRPRFIIDRALNATVRDPHGVADAWAVADQPYGLPSLGDAPARPRSATVTAAINGAGE